MKIVIMIFLYVFIVGNIGRHYCEVTNTKKINNSKINFFFAILIIVLPLLIIGLRSSYNDTEAYISGFNNLPLSLSSILDQFENAKGIGWLLYEWIIKSFITTDANIFLLITSIIELGAVIKFYLKYSNDYSYSMLLFFLSCYFLNLMAGIRQLFAVSLILYFIDYLFEKKYLRFITIIILASFIHVSAIIWIPLTFIVQGEAGNIKTMIAIMLTIFAIMYIDSFTTLLEDTLTGTLYAGYTEQFINDDGANIMHTIIASIPIIISLIGSRQLSHINDNSMNIMINISIVNLLINLLAHFTSGILIGRLPMYFNFFNYALFPLLFKNIFVYNSEKLIRFLCIVGYLLYGLYYISSIGFQYSSNILGI